MRWNFICQQAEEEHDHVWNTGLIFLTKCGGMNFIPPTPNIVGLKNANNKVEIEWFSISTFPLPVSQLATIIMPQVNRFP